MRAGDDGEERCGSAGEVLAALFFDEDEPPAAGAQRDADLALAVDGIGGIFDPAIDAGLCDGFARGLKRQRNHAWDAAKLDGIEHGGEIEIAHLGGGGGFDSGGVNSLNLADSAAPLPKCSGKRLAPDAIGADDAQARNDNFASRCGGQSQTPLRGQVNLNQKSEVRGQKSEIGPLTLAAGFMLTSDF